MRKKPPIKNKPSSKGNATNYFGLPSHPFWEFSTAVYQQASVKEVCLALQNRYGVNVNILLLCGWFAHSGRGPLTQPELQKALAHIEKWHKEIINGLREVRNRLNNFSTTKYPIPKLRRSILNFELVTEQIEQLMLVDIINKRSHENVPTIKKLQDAILSLKTYLTMLGVKITSENQPMLCQLLEGLFTDIPKGDIVLQGRLFTN